MARRCAAVKPVSVQPVCRDPSCHAEVGRVERAQAEAILDGDRETGIGLLLRLDQLVEANQRLVDANERLERGPAKRVTPHSMEQEFL